MIALGGHAMKRKAALLLGCAVLLFAGSVTGQPSPDPEIERLRAVVKNARPGFWQALDQLATMPDPAALNAIIEAMGQPDYGVWSRAMEIIAGMKPLPPVARAALLDLANSPKAYLRMALAEKLGNVRPVEYETLVRLSRDEDSSVRSIAARALGDSGDPRAATRLIEVLAGPQWDAATSGLEKLGPASETALAAALNRPDVTGVQAARIVWILAGIRGWSPQTAEWLVGLLEDRRSPPEVRREAAGVFGSTRGGTGPLDSGFVDRLIALLEDEEISAEAASVLYRRGQGQRVSEALASYQRRREEWERPARQIPRQRAILDSGSPEACRNALRKLALIPDPGALEALAEAAGHKNPDIAREAARILKREVRASNPEFERAYLAAAGSRNPLVRATVARLLGEIGCRDAESLLNISANADSVLRASAAAALGHCRDGRAAVRLVKLLSDTDGDVRSSAKRGLSTMGGAAADALLAALRDAPPATLEAAIELLGELREPRAAAPLVGFLENQRTTDAILGNASEALRRIQPTDPQILDRLTGMLSGRLNEKSWPRMRVAAEVLQTLHSERGADALAAFHEREDQWIHKSSRGDGQRCSVCSQDWDCNSSLVCRLYTDQRTGNTEKRCAGEGERMIICTR